MAGRIVEPSAHLRFLGYRTDRSSVLPTVIGAPATHEPTIEGAGSIYGISSFDGVPAAAQVHLVVDKGSRVVKSVESGDDGAYAFHYLDVAQTFSVVGIDLNDNYNSVIQARITPGVPP